MELIGLTPLDYARLDRLITAYESGQLTRKVYSPETLEPRVYESVRFINAAGETAPAYGLLRITTPTTVDGEKAVNIAKPDGTYRWRYLINGPEDVSDGKTGWGTYGFDGEQILYDTGSTPAVDEHWGPKSGEWKLFQNRPGFILDGRYDSTAGRLWAMQVVPPELLVKNDTGSDKAAGTTQDYNIYAGTQGSEASIGLVVASCYNRTSASFKNGKFGWATYNCGKNYVAPHEQ